MIQNQSAGTVRDGRNPNKPLKYYIAVDLEGVACVVGAPGRGLLDAPDYPFACRQGTKEADAAAKALFDCGADEVWVWDCHGTGVNLDYGLLDERVTIVNGSGSRRRFPGLDRSFAGVLFIGYHAFDAPGATLAHVYSSSAFAGMFACGNPVGELQIDAAVAGKYGVPVLFVSSDDVCVSQGKETFPDATFVVTKKSLAWNSCASKHPEAVCREIYAGVQSACRNGSGTVFTFPSPFPLVVKYKRMEGAQSATLTNPDGTLFERPDPYVRSGMLKDPEDLFRYI